MPYNIFNQCLILGIKGQLTNGRPKYTNGTYYYLHKRQTHTLRQLRLDKTMYNV